MRGLTIPLLGGERSATVGGQAIALGGDIILAAQGIDVLTLDDLIAAARAVRDRSPGQEVRMRVLRAGKVVDLVTSWSGSADGGSAPR